MIYIFCAAGLLTACTDDVMDRLNRNENDPEDVPSRYLFTDAETSSAVNLVSGDFAFYTAVYMEQQAGIFNQMYNAEMRLADVYSAATFNNAWGSTYRNLRALKIIRERCAPGGVESGSNHLLGMAQVLTALNLATLTDLMGDIPWSEALQPGVVYQPKLDSQESIYQDIFSLLDDAIANLKREDLATLTPVGHQDLIYGQYDTDRQAELWIKAAYGLKARYTLRLSYREPRYDRVIDYADSAFVDAGEQLAYPYDGSTSINPFYAFYLNRRYFGQREPAPETRRAQRPARSTLLQGLSRYRQTGVRPQRLARATAGLLRHLGSALAHTPHAAAQLPRVAVCQGRGANPAGPYRRCHRLALQRRGGSLCPGGALGQ